MFLDFSSRGIPRVVNSPSPSSEKLGLVKESYEVPHRGRVPLFPSFLVLLIRTMSPSLRKHRSLGRRFCGRKSTFHLNAPSQFPSVPQLASSLRWGTFGHLKLWSQTAPNWSCGNKKTMKLIEDLYI
ncbi:hypothetical protein KSP39_PZI009810 [Platanthera zijinensis]|uniref:Uncharacterized protein n=1 Tax=Platanthera zijinensis TaxID=2320716 RepID=A0AAP0G650_9ASPA